MQSRATLPASLVPVHVLVLQYMELMRLYSIKNTIVYAIYIALCGGGVYVTAMSSLVVLMSALYTLHVVYTTIWLSRASYIYLTAPVMQPK